MTSDLHAALAACTPGERADVIRVLGNLADVATVRPRVRRLWLAVAAETRQANEDARRRAMPGSRT